MKAPNRSLHMTAYGESRSHVDSASSSKLARAFCIGVDSEHQDFRKADAGDYRGYQSTWYGGDVFATALLKQLTKALFERALKLEMNHILSHTRRGFIATLVAK